MSFPLLLNQTAQIENQTGGSDRHGKPSFGTPRTFKVRAERTSRTIATATQERAPIDIKFFAMGNEVADLDDRITFLGKQYRVMVVSPIILGNGQTHHLEILGQHWSYP